MPGIHIYKRVYVCVCAYAYGTTRWQLINSFFHLYSTLFFFHRARARIPASYIPRGYTFSFLPPPLPWPVPPPLVAVYRFRPPASRASREISAASGARPRREVRLDVYPWPVRPRPFRRRPITPNGGGRVVTV